MNRLFYLTPFTTGLAAYCYSHTIEHPSIAIGLGVFFTAWTLIFITRTIATAEENSEYNKGYDHARADLKKLGQLVVGNPKRHYSLW